eukprot:4013364-Pleurochrysis_carterae.AAC.3
MSKRTGTDARLDRQALSAVSAEEARQTSDEAQRRSLSTFAAQRAARLRFAWQVQRSCERRQEAGEEGDPAEKIDVPATRRMRRSHSCDKENASIAPLRQGECVDRTLATSRMRRSHSCGGEGRTQGAFSQKKGSGSGEGGSTRGEVKVERGWQGGRQAESEGGEKEKAREESREGGWREVMRARARARACTCARARARACA